MKEWEWRRSCCSEPLVTIACMPRSGRQRSGRPATIGLRREAFEKGYFLMPTEHAICEDFMPIVSLEEEQRCAE